MDIQGLNIPQPGFGTYSNAAIAAIIQTVVFDANTLALPAGSTFTRASSATYFDNTGTLQIAANNMPRFDYNPSTLVFRGLLMEGASTNLFLNSQAPVTQTIALVNGQVYTLSFYGIGNIAYTGAATGTLTGTGTNDLVQVTFTAAGTSILLTVAGLVLNAQLEAYPCASSRIITLGASASRSNDLCTNPNVPWYNISSGTFIYEFINVGNGDGTFREVFGTDNGGFSESIQLSTATTANLSQIFHLGAFQLNIGFTMIPLGLTKLGLTYSAAGGNRAQNGGSLTPYGAIMLPLMPTRFIMSGGFTWVRKITYYSGQLSNAALLAATL